MRFLSPKQLGPVAAAVALAFTLVTATPAHADPQGERMVSLKQHTVRAACVMFSHRTISDDPTDFTGGFRSSAQVPINAHAYRVHGLAEFISAYAQGQRRYVIKRTDLVWSVRSETSRLIYGPRGLWGYKRELKVGKVSTGLTGWIRHSHDPYPGLASYDQYSQWYPLAGGVEQRLAVAVSSGGRKWYNRNPHSPRNQPYINACTLSFKLKGNIR